MLSIILSMALRVTLAVPLCSVMTIGLSANFGAMYEAFIKEEYRLNFWGQSIIRNKHSEFGRRTQNAVCLNVRI